MPFMACSNVTGSGIHYAPCKYKLAPSVVSSATVNQRAGEQGQPPLLATMLSKDHKPEDPVETERVESLGNTNTHTHYSV